MSGVGINYSHRTNTFADSIHLWTISISGEDDIPATTTLYQPCTLTVLQTVDEKGNASVQFIDVLGRTVLTKKQIARTPSSGHSGWLCTYNVFDEMNHIRMVLPPKAVDALNNTTNNWSLTTDPTINNNLCYAYFYDSRGRISMKRIPGKGKMYVVYDVWDRPVFTQDANLRGKNQWLGALYDAQGRPMMGLPWIVSLTLI